MQKGVPINRSDKLNLILGRRRLCSPKQMLSPGDDSCSSRICSDPVSIHLENAGCF